MVRVCLVALIAVCAFAQSSSATFGEIIRLGGTPSDAVLDEARGRIYLINSNASRVDVYSLTDKRVIQSIAVGSAPLAGAMSMEGDYLYVTNSGSSSMSVVDLRVGFVAQTVSLSAVPEGVPPWISIWPAPCENLYTTRLASPNGIENVSSGDESPGGR